MKHFNIKEAVETYGIKNIRVFGNGTEVSKSFPYMSTDLDMVEYALSESRYLMTENYKLTLEAVIKDSQLVDTIPPMHHYISDFNSLVNAGCYRVYVLNGDGDYYLISQPATIEVAEEQKFFDRLKAMFTKFSPT